MYEVGRLCMKVAGRDAGRYCLVVDSKGGRLLVDGQTRRRNVNPHHLEPLKKVAEIKKGASTQDVVKALKTFNIEVKTNTWTPPKKAKPAKKTAKKAEKKEEKKE